MRDAADFEIPEALGDMLEELRPVHAFRVWRGMGRSDLATAAHVRPEAIEGYEEGTRGLSFEQETAIAAAFDVPVELLLE